MIFRRKVRNRRQHRHERREVLEVRLRSDRKRASLGWARMLVVLFLVGGVGVVLIARFWDQLRGDFIERNPLFAIKTIEITTDGRWITPQQVRAWAGVREGENLLLLDLQHIKRDLEIIPQLEGITIERVPPHLLRINVREREPVAQVLGVRWTAAGEVAPVTYLLDPTGMVMPPLPVGTVPPDGVAALEALPRLIGLDGRELRPGQAVKSRPVLAALALVRAFAEAPVRQVATLATVDVSDPAVLVVRTTAGVEITLHPEAFDLQFRRWLAVHQMGLQNSNVIATLDLSVTNHCPVVWAPAGSQSPPAPKPAAPERKRKTNV